MSDAKVLFGAPSLFGTADDRMMKIPILTADGSGPLVVSSGEIALKKAALKPGFKDQGKEDLTTCSTLALKLEEESVGAHPFFTDLDALVGYVNAELQDFLDATYADKPGALEGFAASEVKGLVYRSTKQDGSWWPGSMDVKFSKKEKGGWRVSVWDDKKKAVKSSLVDALNAGTEFKVAGPVAVYINAKSRGLMFTVDQVMIASKESKTKPVVAVCRF